MARYTVVVNTGVNEEKGLNLIMGRVNASRAAQTPPLPPLTTQEELTNIMESVITDYKRQYKQDLRERTGAALDAANAAKVTEVAALLGVTE